MLKYDLSTTYLKSELFSWLYEKQIIHSICYFRVTQTVRLRFTIRPIFVEPIYTVFSRTRFWSCAWHLTTRWTIPLVAKGRCTWPELSCNRETCAASVSIKAIIWGSVNGHCTQTRNRSRVTCAVTNRLPAYYSGASLTAHRRTHARRKTLYLWEVFDQSFANNNACPCVYWPSSVVGETLVINLARVGLLVRTRPPVCH